MTHVWHDKEPRFGFNEKPRVFPDDFVKVAEVDVPELDQAYELTNHIGSAWHRANMAEVEPLVENPRSTSVGDIIVDRNNIVHICMMVGWQQIGKIDGWDGVDKIIIEPFFINSKLRKL